MNEAIVKIGTIIENSMVKSRLSDIHIFMHEGAIERTKKILQGLSELSEGAYLFGTGPYSSGIYRLSTDQIIIGRYSLPPEKPCKVIVDIEVKDSICFNPREVSRNHAKIIRNIDGGNFTYSVADLSSTCGTYLNTEKVSAVPPFPILNQGDVLNLGTSGTNAFIFFEI